MQIGPSNEAELFNVAASFYGPSRFKKVDRPFDLNVIILEFATVCLKVNVQAGLLVYIDQCPFLAAVSAPTVMLMAVLSIRWQKIIA